MRTTTVSFQLRAWRRQLGLTQATAACKLGISVSAYASAEYRNEDREGYPCLAWMAKLAAYIMLDRTLGRPS